MRALLDTNILIDFLKGIPAADVELKRYSNPHISRITWMEVMAGVWGTGMENETRSFLTRFQIIELELKVVELAIQVRHENHLKLPDAIIFASAKSIESFLVTRNTKDFKTDWPEVRMPYEV